MLLLFDFTFGRRPLVQGAFHRLRLPRALPWAKVLIGPSGRVIRKKEPSQKEKEPGQKEERAGSKGKKSRVKRKKEPGQKGYMLGADD